MNEQLSNAYSLMSCAQDLSTYQVCVRKDVEGKGGSVLCMISAMKAVKFRFQNQKIYFH
jgi:ferredoxin-NADP reductase